MTKVGCLQYLEKGLKAKHVKDVNEIITDYQEYIEKQVALGKKEVDVVASIGDLDSIIHDYVEMKDGSRKQWFEMVTISMVALPLLIINYGLLIVLIGSALSFWGIAVYYTFGIETLSFMPMIPVFPKVGFIVLALASAVFMMSTSVRFYAILKSMTKQYIVKQAIRIGEYVQSPVYEKIFKISLLVMVTLLVVTYAVSAIVAKDLQFWHIWEWFE
jgi:uncharacterized membrane protein